MTFHIRAAGVGDQPAIQALIFSVLREHGLTPEPEGTDADLSDLQGHYAARGGRFEVAEDSSGHIVGTVGIYPLTDGSCELRKMYLAPEVRGQGLGRRLLERAIAYAREAGFTRLELETAAPLKKAIQLYQTAGFKPLERHLVSRCDQAFVLEL